MEKENHMEEQKQILEQVFGESSESEEDEQRYFVDSMDCVRTEEEEEQKQILIDASGELPDNQEDKHRHFGDAADCNQPGTPSKRVPIWHRIEEVNGLWLCREFLSPEQQSSLLSAIENEGWFTQPSHNQAMGFGNLPLWATELSAYIREVVWLSKYVFECEDGQEYCPLPSDLLWREPLFDQLIVNVYQPGEGICGHVDLMRFDDGIAITSLESACVMHFTRVKTEDVECEERGDAPITKIPVYLNPGSLVLMWGEARYIWKHEINRKLGFQVWEEQEICQKKRTSITLRKLCPTGQDL
ncbi:alkylated DNA repair protein alkB homolog 8 [Macadamia integrifolia]|uniref:alkylated DNA repair protein alkB homolog 8 n=1 Tax=Macadamia integrifolia TaxID=60698 RepID=UPI001C5015E1|nr:alkylated DNA repair protein alkB homolog 8 [Macadamia integrifolia]